MWGRYLLRNAPEDETLNPWGEYILNIDDFTFKPRFNFCPSQTAITVRNENSELYCDEYLRWGFEPVWSSYKPLINAKAENLLESIMFKGFTRHMRCAILADGFYEPKGSSNAKQRPWYVFQFKVERFFCVCCDLDRGWFRDHHGAVQQASLTGS